MLDKLGWRLPYFIQILFSNINKLIKIQSKSISIETIDEAYSNLISENSLNTWDERLNAYSDLEKYARLILKKLSTIIEGESRGNIYHTLYSNINDPEKTEIVVSKLLHMLQNDGYLVFSESLKYAFRSPLLRDFWYDRFVK